MLPRRSLWPADGEVQAPSAAAATELTQPEVTLPWAQSTPGAPAPGTSGPDPGGAAAVEAWDRRPYSLEAHLSLAVALDVLATEVAPLAAQDDVLSAITDALLGLRRSRPGADGLDDADAAQVGAQLRQLALGPIGEARAALAGPLSACTPALGDAASPAQGVVQACAQLVRGAQEVIALGVLALEAKAQQDRSRRP
jgi:hypothetical protein